MTPNPDVVAAAQACERTWRVPACVSIAQYALESGWGAHMPGGAASNNPFGIKAAKGQPQVEALTTEFVGGRPVKVYAAFRAFASLEEAFAAHGELIATAPVYAPAMAKLPDVPGFVDELARHYATDPEYAEKLLGVITADALMQFDVPPAPPPAAATSKKAASAKA